MLKWLKYRVIKAAAAAVIMRFAVIEFLEF